MLWMAITVCHGILTQTGLMEVSPCGLVLLPEVLIQCTMYFSCQGLGSLGPPYNALQMVVLPSSLKNREYKEITMYLSDGMKAGEVLG